MRSSIVLAVLFAGSASAQVTYSREVARIIQTKCQQCHRPNDIAPFALLNYEDTRTYAEDIQRAVSARIMPPWKPAPGYNEFRDSFGLTEEERRNILDWIAAGMAEGDPADLPEPVPANPSPWELGEPEMVLTMPEYTPPARPADTYRCFVLPQVMEETRFVTAAQVLPGQRQTVHHVLLFIDETGQSLKLDGKDGQPGYTCFGGPNFQLSIGGSLGGWAPGLRTRYFPEGIGVLVPKGSRLVMQVHYHPYGLELPDQTKVGLYFAKKDSVNKRLIYIPLVNDGFTIPAGAQNYEVTASLTVLPFLAAKAIVVAPHMHLLGRQIKVESAYQGKTDPLIFIDKWDFNWQGFYTFVEPVRLPVGATVRLTATYDNSENNPKNPNKPIVPVRWGEGTNDEMAVAFIGVVFDNENLLPLGHPNRK
ncbi:MAG: ascorbate-dependent monooxygenase [Bryobacteraceae bacterium]